MSESNYAAIIERNRRPLQPIVTDVAPRLRHFHGLQAVLFDVYGTLLISASGDIGADAGDHRIVALEETCRSLQVQLACPAAEMIRQLEAAISAAHAKARSAGIEYPEVDIVEVWQSVLTDAVNDDTSVIDLRSFALEYEVRANPVWPMPGAASTLDQLRDRGLVLGIVSNAQFFTPLLFRPLLGKSVTTFGFAPQLLYFSYEHRQAKPGNYLYLRAKGQLESLGVSADQVLYVGNDMLNDVTAAASVGFRTALFAGDQRSLRWRERDERVSDVQPDVVVTELSQLLECLAAPLDG
ncbi:MAG: HAD family hydrolase [Planctomycetota bacterium]